MMNERTLIPTFVFWAFLTIITPTLILLSENSKTDLHLSGNITETMKVRRMNRHTQNYIIATPPPPDKLVVEDEELAPAPAASYHNHNHSALIRSSGNITDEDAPKEASTPKEEGSISKLVWSSFRNPE
ncbi:unnamed protein product [Lathyrus sativus]|nr:unnamed protein product [Lathyrus sativus]